MRWCPACRKVQFTAALECGQCGGRLEIPTESFFLNWKPSDRYKVTRMIGRGGIGAVYEGEHLHLKRRVAIKVLMPMDPLNVESDRHIYREARIIARLKHVNIVDVIDFDFSGEGIPYMVMEYLEGQPLSAILKNEPRGLSPGLFFPWMEAICDGVEAAHRAGVIHQDLKPGNIIIERANDFVGHVKILDFGISRIAEATGSLMLSKPGGITGTPRYIAPEQIRGDDTDARTDIYALGVIAFEMWAGQTPFQAEGVIPMLEKHVNEAPPDIRMLRKDTPFQLANAINQALAKSPELRWPSVAAFKKELLAAKHACYDPIDSQVEDAFATVSSVNSPGRRDSSDLVTLDRRKPVAREDDLETKHELPGEDGSPPEPVGKPGGRGGRWLIWVGAALVAIAGLLLAFGDQLGRIPQPGGDDPAGQVTAAPGFEATPATEPDRWMMIERGRVGGIGETKAVFPLAATSATILAQSASTCVWHPRKPLSPPLPLSHAIRGQDDGTPYAWLIDSDAAAVHRLDFETRQIAETIEFPDPFVEVSRLDEEGRRWACLSEDFNRLVIYDAGQEAITGETLLGERASAVVASPGGERLALRGSDGISIVETGTLEETFKIPSAEPVIRDMVLRWSPSGGRLAFGKKKMLIYDVIEKRSVSLLETKGWIMDIGWIDEDEIGVADDRGRLYWTTLPAAEWRSETSAALDSQYKAYWSPWQKRWFLFTINDDFLVYEYRSPALIDRIEASSLPIWTVAADPTGARAAVGGKDNRIAIIDLDELTVERRLEGHTDGVTFLRFLDHATLISSSDDQSIRLWNVETGETINSATAHKSLINSFALTGDGRFLLSVSSDKKVIAWRLPELILEREVMETHAAGATVTLAAGDDRQALITDWSGWAYRLEGEPPDWTMVEERRLVDNVLYMACPHIDGWWAAGLYGPGRGLWRIPRAELESARRESEEPVMYCHSTGESDYSAFAYPNRLIVWNNAEDANTATYHHGWVDGGAVFIDHPSQRLITGGSHGGLSIWRYPIDGERQVNAINLDEP